MIRKLVKRCLLASLCLTLLGLFVIGSFVALAGWTPSFYDDALSEPINDADIAEATEEMEQTMGALQLYLLFGPDRLDEIQELPKENLERLAQGKYVTRERLPAILHRLNIATFRHPESFVALFDERQVNALLLEQFGDGPNELREPRLALGDGLCRLGVTIVTPLAEAVLSCDVKPILSGDSALAFELRALRIGRLPLPTKTLIETLVGAGAQLPRGTQLDLQGRYPRLTLIETPNTAGLRVAKIGIADGELSLELQRTSDAVVAAR